MSTFIDTESMKDAAFRTERAAKEAASCANRIEEALRQFRMLLEDGYGNNACRLIQLLESNDSIAAVAARAEKAERELAEAKKDLEMFAAGAPARLFSSKEVHP